ncbi:DUF1173 family protein [Pantoea agglomerans]|uniref:DUF1173 family protein n=1 Tax=Enterobacter agglomerans TaxID=549 RepID=UPI0010C166EE|nr:DUF1173 family protein [Pantoea agglomerans]MBD8145421.1 DUF1173 family protein [Pantoea agglomerans]MBD8184153.1 DUF1173 family protein [Pantoea agglomerans]MBD8223136.1 DUF1173 family protein [Pantoea agglomerans]TKJ54203.1 hypothetical protein PagCFBP13505_20600 [Pantoea agglomerans]TKK14525.1 hypothetical protein PagCFBP13516_21425 [Pantoea agglomerans]
MSDIKIYPVRFTGQVKSIECSAAFQKEQTDKFKSYIRFARQNKATTHVTCQCRKDGEGENQRRLKACSSSISDYYWLARWSYSGSEHAPDCRFYSVWADDRQSQIYTSEVVKTVSPGCFRIKLPTGLQKKEASGDSTPARQPTANADKKSRRQPTMSLLGLMHFMWEQAEINHWHPNFDKRTRDDTWAAWRLKQIAGKISVGRTSLDSVLLTMAKPGSQAMKNNWAVINGAEKSAKRLILISYLNSSAREENRNLNGSLPLALSAGFPYLDLPSDLIDRVNRSFSREISDWRRGKKVMLIAETEPPVKKFKQRDGKTVPYNICTVIDAALMTVSDRFIPLDSSWEGVIEEKLWQEKRHFIKPLRYDGEADVFPDFLLQDVPGSDAVPLEVFGMSTPDYLARKAEKLKHYQEEYGEGNWWSWDAHKTDALNNIPAFPVKA